MRAVLLFSAVLHIAAIGALAAFALRSWLNANRPKEPTVPEFAAAAATLGLFVALAGLLFSWLGRPFGPALTTGLAGGLLAALTFILTLGTLPHARPGFAEPPHLYVRVAGAGLIAALVLTEVVVFCLLIAAAGRASPWA